MYEDHRSLKATCAVILLNESLNKFRLPILDLGDTGAALYQLNLPANLKQAIELAHYYYYYFHCVILFEGL